MWGAALPRRDCLRPGESRDRCCSNARAAAWFLDCSNTCRGGLPGALTVKPVPPAGLHIRHSMGGISNFVRALSGGRDDWLPLPSAPPAPTSASYRHTTNKTIGDIAARAVIINQADTIQCESSHRGNMSHATRQSGQPWR